MENWYLACHKAGRHNALKAQVFLLQMEVGVFIPQMCYHEPRIDYPGAFRKKVEPLFPGYLFLCFDYNKTHTSKIENCPGISGLVRFGGVITPISDAMVDAIMRLTLSVYPGVVSDISETKRECHGLSRQEGAIISHDVKDNDMQTLIEERDGMARSAMLYRWIAPSPRRDRP